VHVLVPLHVRVMHVVDVHVTPVPWHVPDAHTSLYVHWFPSSQAGTAVQPQPSTASSRQ
jgi:hypothetical protein